MHRCRGSVTFSLLTAWLLGAYCSDMNVSSQRHSQGSRLRKLILSDQLSPAPSPSITPSTAHPNPHNLHQCRRRISNGNLFSPISNGQTDHSPDPSVPDPSVPDPNDPTPNGAEVFDSPSRVSHRGSGLRLDTPRVQEEVRSLSVYPRSAPEDWT